MTLAVMTPRSSSSSAPCPVPRLRRPAGPVQTALTMGPVTVILGTAPASQNVGELAAPIRLIPPHDS